MRGQKQFKPAAFVELRGCALQVLERVSRHRTGACACRSPTGVIWCCRRRVGIRRALCKR